jgi:hypothetical protein
MTVPLVARDVGRAHQHGYVGTAIEPVNRTRGAHLLVMAAFRRGRARDSLPRAPAQHASSP